GRQHEGLACSPQASRPFEELSVQVATPFSWRMRQSLGGVIGMSMWVTPRWLRASTTALAIAGGAPTVADSPTPLAPKGWCGLGVIVLATSHAGVSTAVGSR